MTPTSTLVRLVADLVTESWTPPYEQPLLQVPGRHSDSWPIHAAIQAGVVTDRGDGILIPGPHRPNPAAPPADFIPAARGTAPAGEVASPPVPPTRPGTPISPPEAP